MRETNLNFFCTIGLFIVDSTFWIVHKGEGCSRNRWVSPALYSPSLAIGFLDFFTPRLGYKIALVGFLDFEFQAIWYRPEISDTLRAPPRHYGWLVWRDSSLSVR